MEGEVLGLGFCRSRLRREGKSLSGYLVFSQMNEPGFPLGTCPLSPEYPQWINSSSFSFSCPGLHRRPLPLLGQKALAWVRRDLADGPGSVMWWIVQGCQTGSVAAGNGLSLPQQMQECGCFFSSVSQCSWYSGSLIVSKTFLPFHFSFDEVGQKVQKSRSGDGRREAVTATAVI